MFVLRLSIVPDLVWNP